MDRQIVSVSLTSLYSEPSAWVNFSQPHAKRQKQKYPLQINLFFFLGGRLSLSVRARGDINENVFCAGNCKAAHWMNEPKFFFSYT